MNATIYEFPQDKNWRTLYRDAVCEVDSTKIPDRIGNAKKAIVLRARELFQNTGSNLAEEQALDAAMGYLQALRSTLKRRPMNERSIPISTRLKRDNPDHEVGTFEHRDE